MHFTSYAVVELLENGLACGRSEESYLTEKAIHILGREDGFFHTPLAPSLRHTLEAVGCVVPHVSMFCVVEKASIALVFQDLGIECFSKELSTTCLHDHTHSISGCALVVNLSFEKLG